MHRSDRIYLSKFALHHDPEYLDLDDFDLDDFDLDSEIESDELPEKKSKHPVMPEMDEDMY